MAAAYKGKFNESDKAQEIRTYLLQSECILLNNETILNKEDDSLVNCILGFYKDNEKCSTEFGDIIIDSKSIQNCIAHNKRWNAFIWYLILKQVLENGEVILPLKTHNYHNKKLKTGIIAAPVQYDSIRYFFCVVISCNLNKKLEIYDFNYFTKEKLSEIAANNKRSVHDSNIATSPQFSKSPANILINLLISKEDNLNKPNEQNNMQNKHENSNYNNTTMRNNNKALYESIMKDVAKTVKRHLNESTELPSINETDKKIENALYNDKLPIFALLKENDGYIRACISLDDIYKLLHINISDSEWGDDVFYEKWDTWYDSIGQGKDYTIYIIDAFNANVEDDIYEPDTYVYFDKPILYSEYRSIMRLFGR